MTEGPDNAVRTFRSRLAAALWRARARRAWDHLSKSNRAKRPVIRSIYGLKLSSNYMDMTFSFYVTGVYGPYYWTRLKRINHSFSFIDIGANQGLYAIGATRNRNLVKSYAFEPVAKTHAFLVKNIALNHATDTCVPICKAIAAQTGTAHITTKPDHSGVATLASTNALSQTDAPREEIETIDATDLAKIIGEDDSHPLVVKIDVEGYEPVVLQQLLQSAFSDRIAEFFIEIDESWVDVAEICNTLATAGFPKITRIGDNPTHYDILAERVRPRTP